MIKHTFSGYFAAIVALASTHAAASELATTHVADESSWTTSAMETSKGEDWGAALISTSESGKQVGFRCMEGTLLAAFALEPVDLMSVFKSTGPQKTIRIEVSVNSADAEKQSWSLLKRHHVVATANPKLTRRLYNTFVRGEHVTIDARKRGGGKYILPKPDPEAFASFMEVCGFSAKQS